MTPPRTLPAHAKCLHRKYALNCRDYEQMLADCGNCCEICRRPAAHNTAQKLFIDHDGSVGIWAVRGLLCHWCNSLIAERPGWNVQRPEGADEYLANPWYRRRLAAAGVPIEGPPEPPDGSRLYDTYTRFWVRKGDFWTCTSGHLKGRHTWAQLIARLGPYALTVI